MAFELLMGTGYDESVDWWSIGTILFELLAGVPPFFGDNPPQVFANIVNYSKSLSEFRITLLEEEKLAISDPCWDLITRLICKPEDRLGKRNGTEILGHAFFKKLDIPNLRNQTPPFVPQLSSDEDLSYFDVDAGSVLESQNDKMSSPREKPKMEIIKDFEKERSPNNSFGTPTVSRWKRDQSSPSADLRNEQ